MKESFLEKVAVAVIGALVGAAISGGVSIYLNAKTEDQMRKDTENAVVQVLAEEFDDITKDMSFEKAIGQVKKDVDELKEENENLESEKEDLEKKNAQLNGLPKVSFKTPDHIRDGLKMQDKVNKSVATIDGDIYYSESFINRTFDQIISFNADDNTIYYNTDRNHAETGETKIDLFNTNVLYEGNCYRIYSPSDGNSFSMGSNTYNKGFVIYDDHSLFGEGDGYALFDLQGKYSKISFDVGRTNEYEKQDVTLQLYLNGEYITEYNLDAESPPIPLELDLAYANNMKLLITGGSRVKYGFTNVILYY